MKLLLCLYTDVYIHSHCMKQGTYFMLSYVQLVCRIRNSDFVAMIFDKG